MVKNEKQNRYGNLVVLNRVENDKYGNAQWLCKCDCGNKKITKGAVLRNGHCISCGCKNGGDLEKLRSGEAPIKSIFNSYKSGAKSRNLIFELTVKDVKNIVLKNCFYCNSKPNTKKWAYHRSRYTKGIETDEYIIANGIDRLNNNKGYVLSNCVPCCYICNSMKSKLSKKEFLTHIKKIINNLNKDNL
jgi:hypothetical protein